MESRFPMIVEYVYFEHCLDPNVKKHALELAYEIRVCIWIIWP